VKRDKDAEITRIQAQSVVSQAEVVAASVAIQSLSEEVSTVQASLAGALAREEHALKEKQTAQEEKSAAENVIESLRTEVAAVKHDTDAEIARIQAQSVVSQAEVVAAAAAIESLSEEVSTIKASLADALAREEQALANVAEHQTHAKAVSDRLQEAQARNSELEEKAQSIQAQLKEWRKELKCPITHQLMQDPVVAADGYSYERSAFARRFNHATSSVTNSLPKNGSTIPNLVVAKLTCYLRELTSIPDDDARSEVSSISSANPQDEPSVTPEPPSSVGNQAYSKLLSQVQGRWRVHNTSTVCIVKGLTIHVTMDDGTWVESLEERDNKLWWKKNFFVDHRQTLRVQNNGVLQWQFSLLQTSTSILWHRVG